MVRSIGGPPYRASMTRHIVKYEPPGWSLHNALTATVPYESLMIAMLTPESSKSMIATWQPLALVHVVGDLGGSCAV
jgi:hypothetical protein